ERLAGYILEGTKEGLKEDLDEALKTSKPLDIINGPLMKGMDEVGRLFNKNELIVAEVLQSAEAMKAAVAHLEPHMDKVSTASRGTVVLATVKGDVHDIGKNLVDIILSNNGFTVINLGIKIPPEQLIAAIEQHQPDILGLSGLLVKSAQQMVLTADDLTKAGVKIPMLVGGAALSRNFTDFKIARAYSGVVAYASDAMEGLELAKKIRDPQAFEKLQRELKERQEKTPQEKTKEKVEVVAEARRSAQVPPLEDLPAPPDHQRHIIRNTPLDHIWPFINPLMLYGKHLGVKGRLVKLFAQGDRKALLKEEDGPKALEIFETVEAVKEECRKGLMHPAAVYQFFDASSSGNYLHLFNETGEMARFEFPRQKKPEGLSIADYVHPLMPPPPHM